MYWLEAHCSLCENAHAADSKVCPIRSREHFKTQRTLGHSRAQAWSSVKKKQSSYSSVAGVEEQVAQTLIQRVIKDLIVKFLNKIVDRLI